MQSLFERNGFVKIPLLKDSQVDKLVELFQNTLQQHATVASLHHTTTETANADLIYQVDSTIKSVYVPELEKILNDFESLVGCFHIKEPSAGSATGAHQDPTFVDETKYCSANVWVALQDTDKKNGNLYFIRGSNHAVKSLRIVPETPNYYASFNDSLAEMAVHVPLKKGEAVIFNNATIHGATENLSGQLRLAATLLICSKNAEWLLYYKERNAVKDKIEQYHLDLDIFISMPKDGKPDSKSFKQYISFTFPEITKEDFIKKVGADRGRLANYFQKIKNVFRTEASV
ncbi:MAG: phytanoyl-CoA dioxygenase family protein [Chitinophagales bacterium]|nr:phytanoyl-CoA dioxygenase family protein [Chitinophagales bacterium]